MISKASLLPKGGSLFIKGHKNMKKLVLIGIVLFLTVSVSACSSVSKDEYQKALDDNAKLKRLTKVRVLEEDNVILYGVSEGLYTYKSTMGGNITIPLINVERIDIK